MVYVIKIFSLIIIISLAACGEHQRSSNTDDFGGLAFQGALDTLKRATKTYTIFREATPENGQSAPLILIGENHYWAEPESEDFLPRYRLAYNSFRKFALKGQILMGTETGELGHGEKGSILALEGTENLATSMKAVGGNYFLFSSSTAKYLDGDSKYTLIEQAAENLSQSIFSFFYYLRISQINLNSFRSIDRSLDTDLKGVYNDIDELLEIRLTNEYLAKVAEKYFWLGDTKDPTILAKVNRQFLRINKRYFETLCSENKTQLPDLSWYIKNPIKNFDEYTKVTISLRNKVQAAGALKFRSQKPKLPFVAIIGEAHRFGVKKLILETKKYKVVDEGEAPQEYFY